MRSGCRKSLLRPEIVYEAKARSKSATESESPPATIERVNTDDTPQRKQWQAMALDFEALLYDSTIVLVAIFSLLSSFYCCCPSTQTGVLKILSHEDPGKEIEKGQEGFSTLSRKREERNRKHRGAVQLYAVFVVQRSTGDGPTSSCMMLWCSYVSCACMLFVFHARSRAAWRHDIRMTSLKNDSRISERRPDTIITCSIFLLSF